VVSSVASTIAPLDLISAHAWRRATFTTYSFSASFAEAVLVEALMRQGVAEITILTDPLGYRMALRERGAVRIGREYVVHPVAVGQGCFHPKLMVLEADDATHVMAGSNNLTFGGWSANLECVEHIHTVGMAAAVDDVGRFFTTLADAPNCKHDARAYCRDLGARLASAATAGRDDGAVRVLSSLEEPISDSLQAAAVKLGGAKALTIASPYWEATAIERLAKALGVSEIRAHVPLSQVPAPKGMDWPRDSGMVRPVRVGHLAVEDAAARGLHAKMFEVVCTRGRLVLSGSANATGAALTYGGATARNVEVCVLRIDGRAGHRWSIENSKAPTKPKAVLDTEEDEAEVGVLIAAHVDSGIEGRILTPWNAVSARATMEVARRELAIGIIDVKKGAFVIPLGDFDDEELSLEGRIQLRLESGDEIAEGFVTAPDFGAIRGRAGKALPSMLAVLKNLQTPEDVLAVMEFFRANPETLRIRATIQGRATTSAAAKADPVVDAELVGHAPDSGKEKRNGGGSDGKDELAWQRFIARILQAFAKGPAPTDEDDEDEADRTEKARRKRIAQARHSLETSFPELFQKLTATIASDVELVNLARLTHFVCVATEHPLTEGFVVRLVGLGKAVDLSGTAKDVLAWCIAQLAAKGTTLDAASARGRMLSLGIDPDRTPEPDCALSGFGNLLAHDADLDAVFAAIRATRTVHDDVRALEEGLKTDIVPEGLEILARHASWNKLLEYCRREPARRRIRFVDQPVSACTCNIVLPQLKDELARHGVCDTGCHGFVLVRNP
jgi:hypothetical protein